MNKKKKIILITAIATLLCIGVAIGAVWKLNKYSLVLSIPDDVITLEYGVDEMPKITALCKGTLINRKGIPVDTSMDGEVDLAKLGEYKVVLTAHYKKVSFSENRTF